MNMQILQVTFVDNEDYMDWNVAIGSFVYIRDTQELKIKLSEQRFHTIATEAAIF